MVRFAKEAYVSDKVRTKLSSIKWKMACGIGMTGLHFITLADNPNDLFDIYPAYVFKQKRIRKSERVIIGVADSNSSATALIEKMINECLQNDGGLSDVRGYFEDMIRNET